MYGIGYVIFAVYLTLSVVFDCHARPEVVTGMCVAAEPAVTRYTDALRRARVVNHQTLQEPARLSSHADIRRRDVTGLFWTHHFYHFNPIHK